MQEGPVLLEFHLESSLSVYSSSIVGTLKQIPYVPWLQVSSAVLKILALNQPMAWVTFIWHNYRHISIHGKGMTLHRTCCSISKSTYMGMVQVYKLYKETAKGLSTHNLRETSQVLCSPCQTPCDIQSWSSLHDNLSFPECPGDPWETSIPRMIVGTWETNGIEGFCSTANSEFKPPSCIKTTEEWKIIQPQTVNALPRTI